MDSFINKINKKRTTFILSFRVLIIKNICQKKRKILEIVFVNNLLEALDCIWFSLGAFFKNIWHIELMII